MRVRRERSAHDCVFRVRVEAKVSRDEGVDAESGEATSEGRTRVGERVDGGRGRTREWDGREKRMGIRATRRRISRGENVNALLQRVHER